MHKTIRSSLNKAAWGALAIFTAMISCKKNVEVGIPPITTMPDLTHLPFGGKDSTKILIRNQGSPNPDFLSLWLCGLPANGAGANNASDWTNA